MPTVSKNTSDTPRSPIREINAIAWKLKEEPNALPVLNLSVGQPDFRAPIEAIEATKKALDEGKTTYIQSAGITHLRKELCSYYKKLLTPLDAAKKLKELETLASDNFLVTHGCGFSIISAMLATLDAGDEVLVPDPGFVNYKHALKILHAKPVTYELHAAKGFVPEIADIEKLITGKTKMIMINSPNNPTGSILSLKFLQEIVDLCRRRDIFLLSDEVYAEIMYEKDVVSGNFVAPSILQCNIDWKTENNFLLVSSMSKKWSMTGFRCGWLIAHKTVFDVAEKTQEPMVSCGVEFTQYGAVAALNSDDHYLSNMRETYKKRRDIALQILKDHGLYEYQPEGAFYILVQCYRESIQFATELVKKHRVVVAPGTGFGNLSKNYVRVAFCTDEKILREGLEILCRVINEERKLN